VASSQPASRNPLLDRRGQWPQSRAARLPTPFTVAVRHHAPGPKWPRHDDGSIKADQAELIDRGKGNNLAAERSGTVMLLGEEPRQPHYRSPQPTQGLRLAPDRVGAPRKVATRRCAVARIRPRGRFDQFEERARPRHLAEPITTVITDAITTYYRGIHHGSATVSHPPSLTLSALTWWLLDLVTGCTT